MIVDGGCVIIFSVDLVKKILILLCFFKPGIRMWGQVVNMVNVRCNKYVLRFMWDKRVN